MKVITRFAPSPSGLLHIGGARTALFNFVFAKANNGIFRLRIENTDNERQSKRSIESIINDLDWLGIKHNEKIVLQKLNIDKHIKVAEEMIENDLAYKCFMTVGELNDNKVNKSKIKFRSVWRDKKFESHPKTKPYVIRFKTPLNSKIEINDIVQGKISVKSEEIDDYILVRSDGNPTFLLSSAVDDVNMRVTHIIRGDDHLTNSFRQFHIFKYLKQIPLFAHIPLIHNKDGKKLSKRDNVPSISDYKKNGIFKESLINYLLRLGWSLKDKEIISIEEAISHFKLETLGKSPAIIDEKKINFLNSHYFKNKSEEYLSRLLFEEFKKNKITLTSSQKKILEYLFTELKNRSNSITELYKSTAFIHNFNNLITSSEDKETLNNTKFLKSKLLFLLNKLNNWNERNIEFQLKKFLDSNNLKFKSIGPSLRLAITKKLNSPSIIKIMEVLGKKEVIKRLDQTW